MIFLIQNLSFTQYLARRTEKSESSEFSGYAPTQLFMVHPLHKFMYYTKFHQLSVNPILGKYQGVFQLSKISDIQSYLFVYQNIRYLVPTFSNAKYQIFTTLNIQHFNLYVRPDQRISADLGKRIEKRFSRSKQP